MSDRQVNCQDERRRFHVYVFDFELHCCSNQNGVRSLNNTERRKKGPEVCVFICYSNAWKADGRTATPPSPQSNKYLEEFSLYNLVFFLFCLFFLNLFQIPIGHCMPADLPSSSYILGFGQKQTNSTWRKQISQLFTITALRVSPVSRFFLS